MMTVPRVSILMSVYNEKSRWISESIDSIINQSFKDFELIIINDNPDRDDIEKLIESFSDSRIVYLKNQDNVGLAMSMNKAASMAKGKFIARMDADDICEPDRIQLEYEVLKTDLYDFVFSNYSMINENSKLVDNGNNKCYTPYEIKNILNFRQIIQHPTVMMRKDLFEKVGCYRNFLCAQDYDLWLRLNENNCRFYMIKESLIKYRINSTGTSHRLWYTQRLTIYYILYLSLQRYRTGEDNYSYNNYLKFLKNYHHDSNHYKLKLINSYTILYKACRNGNLLKASYYFPVSLFKSKALRFHLKNCGYKFLLILKKEIQNIINLN